LHDIPDLGGTASDGARDQAPHTFGVRVVQSAPRVRIPAAQTACDLSFVRFVYHTCPISVP
jgi:hypothetical protein